MQENNWHHKGKGQNVHQRPGLGRAGFKRHEFQTIIGLASQHPDIKDARPYQDGDHIAVYLHHDATQSPAIWVEKYHNGPRKDLFIAYSNGAGNRAVQVARSEKFDSFMDQLRHKLDVINQTSAQLGHDSKIHALTNSLF